jgi:pimeloyl-ACP methyl ester carboxylesterase
MLTKVVKLLFILFISVAVNTQAQEAPVFVLVPGAWHGGWSWQKVSTKLQAQGNKVYTPTLSGLGEYRHISHANIDLETHITDIVNLLVMEDLHQVVLVGHSYAGAVIAGVADRIPERISKLVFLDAMLVENGQSPLSLQTPEGRATFDKAAKPYKMLSIPPMSAKIFGVTDTASLRWVTERLTLQPYKTFAGPLVLKHPYGNGLPLIYIACLTPQLPVLKQFADKAKNSKDWQYFEMHTGHDAMITAPDDLAALLINIRGK